MTLLQARATKRGVPPFAVVKPNRVAWVTYYSAPALVVPGVVLLLGGYTAGWLCVLVGLGNFLLSARLIWRWRRAVAAPANPSTPPLSTSHTSSQAFLSGEAAWAPGAWHKGFFFRPGLVVVRPGWIAFLPTRPRSNFLSRTVQVIAGVNYLGAIAYDLPTALAKGLQVLDQTVLDAANQDGLVLPAANGQLARWRNGVMFFVDGKTYVSSRSGFSENLLAGWGSRSSPFDTARVAGAFALLSLVPATLGAVMGVVAYHRGASVAELCVGIGFWALLFVGIWVGFLVLYVRVKRARNPLG